MIIQPSYKSFQTALSMRPSPVSFGEMHVLPLTEEDLIQRTQEPAYPPKAFYNSKEKGKSKSNSKSKSKKNSEYLYSKQFYHSNSKQSQWSLSFGYNCSSLFYPPIDLHLFSPLHHPSIPTLVNFVTRLVMLQELA